MQLAEIESELMIANARTVEEVVDIFGYISNKFLTVKTSEFDDLIQIN